MDSIKNTPNKKVDFRDSFKVVMVFMAILFLGISCSTSQLHKAIIKNDHDKAEKLIREKKGIHKTDDRGNTALHYAAVKNRPRVIKYLIDAGADVNHKNTYGSTPLKQASMFSTPEAVSALIDAGADVNEADKKGFTPLMASLAKKNDKITEILLENGAGIRANSSIGFTPLLFAAETGQKKFVERFISNGADIHHKSKAGYTAIKQAAGFGNAATLSFLISAGADVNVKDQKGYTPLMAALSEKKIENAKVLIEAGADLSVKDPKGRSLLEYLCIQGKADKAHRELAVLFFDENMKTFQSEATGPMGMQYYYLAWYNQSKSNNSEAKEHYLKAAGYFDKTSETLKAAARKIKAANAVSRLGASLASSVGGGSAVYHKRNPAYFEMLAKKYKKLAETCRGKAGSL